MDPVRMPLPTKLKSSLRALTHRNYRLFFTGQAISLIGTWMTRLASSWLVYRLTNDPLMLGIVSFASLVPAFLLAPFAGVLVDQSRNLRRLIMWTQLFAMVQSFGLAAASAAPFSPHVIVMLLIALNVVQGTINAFAMPARQAFLPRMIPDPRNLANGIALNSTLFNSARLIGPAIAGVLISLVGETWCFLIDAVSFIAVLWALWVMILPTEPRRVGRRPPMLRSLAEGFRYAYDFEPIRAVLILVAVLSFMGMPYTVLLPVYAKTILRGGADTLGLLTSAAGLGAVVAALRLAGRESIAGIGKLIVVAGVLFAGSLIAFAYSRYLPLSLALLLVIGFGMLSQSTSCNTILQTLVEPDKRGRVMSLYSSAFVGMAPFGSLFSGYLARIIGTPDTLALCGACCGLSTAFFAWKLPRVRLAAAARRGEPDIGSVEP